MTEESLAPTALSRAYCKIGQDGVLVSTTNDPDAATLRMAGTLPGLLGIEVTELGEGCALGRMVLQPHHLAPNGYLHAASVVALADTLAGYGCFHNRPDGATGFTTIELKSNFLGTARAGALVCEARLQHGGRTTQVWDATVCDVDGKQLALFRCTQLILYPRA